MTGVTKRDFPRTKLISDPWWWVWNIATLLMIGGLGIFAWVVS